MERCKKRCKNVFLLLLCLILASGLCACDKKGKEEKKAVNSIFTMKAVMNGD